MNNVFALFTYLFRWQIVFAFNNCNLIIVIGSLFTCSWKGNIFSIFTYSSSAIIMDAYYRICHIRCKSWSGPPAIHSLFTIWIYSSIIAVINAITSDLLLAVLDVSASVIADLKINISFSLHSTFVTRLSRFLIICLCSCNLLTFKYWDTVWVDETSGLRLLPKSVANRLAYY